MFDGSQFFHLLKKWKEDDTKSDFIPILKEVMNHYFDSLAGTCIDSNKLKIHTSNNKTTGFTVDEISYVLDEVGYQYNSVEFPKGKTFAIVTLRNSL